METNLSRRGFLTGAAAAGALAAMGLAGCAPTPAAEGGTKTADTGAAAATSWRDKPEMPTEFVETVDADIVVVGAGNGGLVAATTAAQNGAKVVVLEKAGAIAAAREAIGALNSKLAPDHQEDVPTLLNHANQTQAGDANMLMYKTWAEKSGEMIEWMADTLGPKGMLFPFEWHCPDDPHAYYPAMCYNPCLDEYNPDGPNYTSYTHLEVMADVFTTDLGGEIRFETPAQQLLIDEAGRVTGVVAEGKEGFVQVNAAKGVIVCAGDYSANPEMAKELLSQITNMIGEDGQIVTSGYEGDGLKLCYWAGGQLDPYQSSMGGDYYYPCDSPADPLGSAASLWINADGKRYCNEGFGFMEWAAYAGALQPAGKIANVFDSNYEALIKAQPACHMGIDYPNGGMDGLPAILEAAVAGGPEGSGPDSNPVVYAANDYETLGGYLGYEGEALDNFVASIERYNELCAAGVDEDFGKRRQCLSSLTEPPFYGVHAGTTLLVTMGGLKINENQQVIDADAHPIEGLWAAGNCSGSFFFGDYPITISGASHGRACTGGRRAGQFAADRALGA